MGLGKIVKLISKNMTIITIGAAFVLGFIGMSDVKAVLLNPSDDSVALFDTSTWFKKNDTGNAAGEDEGLRIVSEIGLSDEDIEALNNRGSGTEAVETDENGNPVDPSATTEDPALATSESSSEVTEESTSETTSDPSASTDETLDPSLSESSTEATTEDPKATTTTTKTSETTKESTTATTTKETATEPPETTTEATEPPTENTEPPETTTEAPPPETTTEAPPPETTTEAPPPETTTEAPPPETTTEAPDSMGATGGSYDGDWAKTVLSLVNEERAANGLGPLEWSGGLAKAAKTRAAEIVVKWSHTRPDGSEWYTVSDLTYGENLAYGQTSPSEVVEAWMNSAGHKANILSSSFTTLGVACYYYDGTYYWAQEFGY